MNFGNKFRKSLSKSGSNNIPEQADFIWNKNLEIFKNIINNYLNVAKDDYTILGLKQEINDYCKKQLGIKSNKIIDRIVIKALEEYTAQLPNQPRNSDGR